MKAPTLRPITANGTSYTEKQARLQLARKIRALHNAKTAKRARQLGDSLAALAHAILNHEGTRASWATGSAGLVILDSLRLQREAAGDQQQGGAGGCNPPRP